MRSQFLFGAIIAGGMTLAVTLTTNLSAADAAGPKNLQVLPKNMPKKELKKAMKGISDALGVECDYCHDMDDMSKDTKKKQVGRSMMKMTNDLNKKYFKGKPRVKCVTCHGGKEEPK